MDQCQIWRTRKELIKSLSYLIRDWIQYRLLYVYIRCIYVHVYTYTHIYTYFLLLHAFCIWLRSWNKLPKYSDPNIDSTVKNRQSIFFADVESSLVNSFRTNFFFPSFLPLIFLSSPSPPPSSIRRVSSLLLLFFDCTLLLSRYLSSTV